jgi:hypothetical protein
MHALELFLPDRGRCVVESVKVEGHYGNEMLLLQVKMKNSKDVKYFVDLIKDRLSLDDLDRLRAELPERVDDDCVLHIRFDKQKAFMGEVALATSQDVISAQLKIRAYPALKQKAIEAVSKLF